MQTYCSESDWAHGYVLSRYGVTDTEAPNAGLLGRRIGAGACQLPDG